MAAVFDYMRNIAYFLLFAAVAGMIAPDEKYRKYGALVTGLILIVLLLQPLKAFTEAGGIPVTRFFAGLINAPDSVSGGADVTSYENLQYETVKAAFEEQLRIQLSALLSRKGHTLLAARFEFADDLSAIEYIRAEVEISRAPERRPFIYIEPVRISVSGQAAEQEESPEAAEIKKLIGDFYNLQAEHIHIEIR